jgi:hypothetical protein
MMVYKYWDSITKEDLEFSVGGKANVWEIKDDYEPVPAGDQYEKRGYGGNAGDGEDLEEEMARMRMRREGK